MEYKLVLKNVIEAGNVNYTRISIIDTDNNVTRIKSNRTGSDTYLKWQESKNFRGNNLMVVGSSILGSDYDLENVYQGYISNFVTDVDGVFSSAIKLMISCTNSPFIKIIFDEKGNVFPTKYKIAYGDVTEPPSSSVMYDNNKPYIVIPNSSNNSYISVFFYNMNNSYSALRISYISSSTDISFTQETGLINFVRGSQCIDNPDKPKFGLISNYGSCSFYDNDYQLEYCALMGYLDNPKEVEFSINGVVIGTYLTSTITKNGQIVKMELTDRLSALKDINVDVIKKDTYLSYVAELLSYVENAGFIIGNKTFFTIKRILYSIPMNFYSTSGTLWDKVTQLCEYLGANIYCDEKGRLVGIEI